MRYNTGNPVGTDGSSDPRDLYDNAAIIDLLMTGPLGEYLNRLGVPLKSWVGIMQQVTDYLIAQGYESVYLAYGAGILVERQTQLVQRSGELYRVMNASDIPLTLTGTWATDAPRLQAVGDAALRQALATGDGSLVGIEGGTNLKEWAKHLKFPEQFSSLEEWASSGGGLGIAKKYTAGREVVFPFGTTIHAYGEAEIDFSLAANSANFPSGAHVTLGGGSLTQLPALNTIAAGDLTIGFKAPHGLKPGDVYIIYNATDFSYSAHRAEYRAGEFCRVARVPATDQVVLDAPVYSAYAEGSATPYLLNGGKVNVVGKLRVKGSDTLTSVRAVRGRRLINSDIGPLQAISPIGPAAVDLHQCYEVSGEGVDFEQWSLSGTGTDYGLCVSNSQGVRMKGSFSASRHGITTGGYSGVGDVPCRDIQLSGLCKSTFQGGVPALVLHGNTERFSFHGLNLGGAVLAGNFTELRGDVFGAGFGTCVGFAELSGHDHDIATCRLKTLSNPGTARGVIDLGGNTEPSVASTLGGTINMQGVHINAPSAVRGITCRQRNSTATDIRLDMKGLTIDRLAAGAVSILVDNPSGSAFNRLMRAGLNDLSGGSQSISGSSVAEILGGRASGHVDITTATTSASASAAVTFPAGLFGSALPEVQISIDRLIIGTKGILSGALSQTATGFTASIATVDGTNFASALTVRFSWSASTPR